MSTWRLDVGTGPTSYDLRDTCTRASVQLTNQGSDFLRVQTMENVAVAALWTEGQAAKLYEVDAAGTATLRFVGTFVSPAIYSGASDEGREYVIEGPWRGLRRRAYRQNWKKQPAGTLVAVPRVFLWAGRTTTQQISDVLTYAITAGANLQAGTFATGLTIVPQKAENLLCHDVILRSLRLTPDVGTWIDYSTAPPTLNVTAGDAVTLAFSDSISELRVQYLSDQMVPFVRLSTLQQVENTIEDDDALFMREIETAIYPADNAGTAEGGIDFVIEKLDDWTINLATLAQKLYEARRAVGYEGELTIVNEECTWTLKPSARLNVTGLATELATMAGVVQQVTHELFNGTTKVSFGPPLHLELADLQQIYGAARAALPPPLQGEVNEQGAGTGDESYGFKKNEADGRAPTNTGLYYWIQENGVKKPFGPIGSPGKRLVGSSEGNAHEFETNTCA